MMDFLVLLFLRKQNPTDCLDLDGCVSDDELISFPIDTSGYVEKLDRLPARQCLDRLRLLCTNRL